MRAGEEHEGTGGADMEGWLSDAAGPFRSPPRVERDLFGASADPGAGVHRRPTAPLEPLGEGREALDADMRSRFTNRLQAEETTAPLSGGVDGAPVARPIDVAGPALGPAADRPTTLPGIGVAEDDEAPIALPTPSELPAIQAALKPTFQMAAVPDEGKALPLARRTRRRVAERSV